MATKVTGWQLSRMARESTAVNTGARSGAPLQLQSLFYQRSLDEPLAQSKKPLKNPTQSSDASKALKRSPVSLDRAQLDRENGQLTGEEKCTVDVQFEDEVRLFFVRSEDSHPCSRGYEKSRPSRHCCEEFRSNSHGCGGFRSNPHDSEGFRLNLHLLVPNSYKFVGDVRVANLVVFAVLLFACVFFVFSFLFSCSLFSAVLSLQFSTLLCCKRVINKTIFRLTFCKNHRLCSQYVILITLFLVLFGCFDPRKVVFIV